MPPPNPVSWAAFPPMIHHLNAHRPAVTRSAQMQQMFWSELSFQFGCSQNSLESVSESCRKVSQQLACVTFLTKKRTVVAHVLQMSWLLCLSRGVAWRASKSSEKCSLDHLRSRSTSEPAAEPSLSACSIHLAVSGLFKEDSEFSVRRSVDDGHQWSYTTIKHENKK